MHDTLSFQNLLKKLDQARERLYFRDVAPGTLLTVSMEPPGYSRLVLLVGQRSQHVFEAGLHGAVQRKTQLAMHIEHCLQGNGVRLPLDNLPGGIFGSCDFVRHVDQPFFAVTSVTYIEVGKCLLWAVGQNHETNWILTPGRISEITVHGK